MEAAITVGTPTPTAAGAPRAAQHHGAADRAGHVHLRLRHPDRGDPVVPRHRHPAGDADLGQHHGRGPLAVPHLSRTTSSIPACSWRWRCWPSTCWATACATRSIRASPSGCEARMADSRPRPRHQRPHASACRAAPTAPTPSRTSRSRVGPGEIVCVVGESGSGKSVTAQAVMGLLPRELDGRARARSLLEGEDVLQATPRAPARPARHAHGHDLPGADDGAQPGHDRGRPDRRGAGDPHRALGARAAPARAARSCARCTCPSPSA